MQGGQGHSLRSGSAQLLLVCTQVDCIVALPAFCWAIRECGDAGFPRPGARLKMRQRQLGWQLGQGSLLSEWTLWHLQQSHYLMAYELH